jgi:serine/threonine protein kinase
MPSKEDFKSYGIDEYSAQDKAPYTLGNLSFKGSVGEVYKGVEKIHNYKEGRIVAIKRIDLFKTKKEDQIHAARECRILRGLDHPNIVKFEAAYHVEAEELLFLVISPRAPVTLLDFIENIDKNNRSSKCPWYSFGFLPPMLQIIRQLMEGLNYLHTLDVPIKHKDLKPQNILLHYTKVDPFVRPIIIDFNISKEIIPGMHTTHPYTYMYQAPEQTGGKPTTTKSNVFSLGCCLTLIEGILLAGRLGVRKVHDAVTDSKTGQFATSTDDVNEILDNMINKFFAKESESCPDSATGKVARLKRFDSELDIRVCNKSRTYKSVSEDIIII